MRDLFSGSEVFNVKGCQNYFTEKEESGWGSRKENRHTGSSRARYVYFTSFDLSLMKTKLSMLNSLIIGETQSFMLR